MEFIIHRSSFIVALLIVLGVGCSKKPLSTTPPPASKFAAEQTVQEAVTPAELFWPGWRGQNTSGIATDDFNLSAHWNLGTDVRWKTPLPGRGNSSPVVVGNFVLVTAALGDDEGSKLVVLALDRRDGGLRWQTEAGTANGGTHDKNGFASASVVTDGKHVFASFGSAGLYAFDLQTGAPKWKAELTESGELEHQWGAASSPVLVGELVIQLTDAKENSAIQAFRKDTGERVWRTARESNGSWSTPVVVESAGAEINGAKPQVAVVVNGTGTSVKGGGWVIAYDPESGRELWRAQGTSDIPCPSIIWSPSTSLAISTSGRNGPIFGIRPGGSGDVTNSHIAWKLPRGGAYVPTGIEYQQRLYLIADGGVLTCLNPTTGDTVWRDRVQGNFTASLVAGDGKVFAASEAGTVYAFAAADEFQLLATNDLDDRILATPALANGQILVRTETALWCIGEEK